MKKTLFVCALLVVSSFSLFAQHRGSNALGQSVSKTVTAPASVKHTLKGTYLNNATIGLSTAGFTNIDTQGPALLKWTRRFRSGDQGMAELPFAFWLTEFTPTPAFL